MLQCYRAGLMASKGDTMSRCADLAFTFSREAEDAQPGRYFSLTLRFLTDDFTIGPNEHTDSIQIEIYKSNGEYLFGGVSDYSAIPDAVDVYVMNPRIAVYNL